MSKVWLCLPSARPAVEADVVFRMWHEMGYGVAVQRDPGQAYDSRYIDVLIERPYKGWPESVNYLAKLILEEASVEWIVTAGDDTNPDLSHHAGEIADECSQHFHGTNQLAYAEKWRANGCYGSNICPGWMRTFGVMQPTGDRWGDDAYSRIKWPDAPAMIDRICGSPWMGREFCLKINQGTGPLWREYFHNWADEELQNVAIKYGCFLQRRDLIQYHDHARRKGGPWQPHQAGFDADYTKMKPIFEARKAAGFPGSEPL